MEGQAAEARDVNVTDICDWMELRLVSISEALNVHSVPTLVVVDVAFRCGQQTPLTQQYVFKDSDLCALSCCMHC